MNDLAADKHPAFLRFRDELLAAGATIESKLPNDTKDLICRNYLIEDGDNKWQFEPEYFKDSLDDLSQRGKQCHVQVEWMTFRNARFLQVWCSCYKKAE